MRKFVSIAGLICIVLMLAGCSVKVLHQENDPIVTANYDGKTGEIAQLVIALPDNKLPLRFQGSYENKAGTLEIFIYDPTGKEVFKDKMFDNMSTNKASESLKEKWGFYNFDKVMDLKGDYTIKITGDNATGQFQVSPWPKKDIYFINFTGIAVKTTIDVKDTSKEIGINLQAIPTQDNKGVIMAKIYDPDGIEIRSTRITYDPNNPNTSMLDFWEKPAKMGTYTAVIEAKDASGSALGAIYDQKDIPWVAYIKPVIFILIGLALYFIIKPKDRKMIVWGGLFWVITTLLVNVLFGMILKTPLDNVFYGPYSEITKGLIITAISSVITILIIWFSRFFAEIKNASPTELVAFVFGLAFVNPLMMGINSFAQISSASSEIAPALSVLTVPGIYPTSAMGTFEISTSAIALICQTLGTIAASIVFLWVVRQKEMISKSTLWLAATGAVVLKVVIDLANLYSKSSTMLMLIDKPIVGLKLTYGLATPTVETIICIGILVVIAVLLIVNWKKIMGLALKACPVTIDDLTNKEAK